MISLTVGAVRGLLLSETSEISTECARVVRSALIEGDPTEVKPTFPVASEVLEVYQYRCDAIDGLKESRFGWDEFFSSLSRASGRVAMLSIMASGWRLLILLDESVQKALACLCRPPD